MSVTGIKIKINLIGLFNRLKYNCKLGNSELLSSSYGNEFLDVDSLQSRERASSYGVFKHYPGPARKTSKLANSEVAVDSNRVDGISVSNVTSGKINVLFHYVGVNSKTGMLLSPTSRELASIDGIIQRKIITKFYWACAVIRNTFLSGKDRSKVLILMNYKYPVI